MNFYVIILCKQFILELNSPKAAIIKVATKPQDPVNKLPMFNIPNKPTTGNGVSSNDCKEYMMSLEKELGNLLKSKPSMKGMKNMGMDFAKVVYCIITIYLIYF